MAHSYTLIHSRMPAALLPQIVRCAMRLSHADPDQSGRRFVLTYFLEDASLSVFEQALPNSGHPGGKFMERDV